MQQTVGHSVEFVAYHNVTKQRNTSGNVYRLLCTSSATLVEVSCYTNYTDRFVDCTCIFEYMNLDHLLERIDTSLLGLLLTYSCFKMDCNNFLLWLSYFRETKCWSGVRFEVISAPVPADHRLFALAALLIYNLDDSYVRSLQNMFSQHPNQSCWIT